MEPKVTPTPMNVPGRAARNARRIIDDAGNARTPLSAPMPIGRPAITYRGARRNGARTIGRMYPREPGKHPWWIGIQPNARLLVDAKTPKGKGFGVGGALANFFFPGKARMG